MFGNPGSSERRARPVPKTSNSQIISYVVGEFILALQVEREPRLSVVVSSLLAVIPNPDKSRLMVIKEKA